MVYMTLMCVSMLTGTKNMGNFPPEKQNHDDFMLQNESDFWFLSIMFNLYQLFKVRSAWATCQVIVTDLWCRQGNVHAVLDGVSPNCSVLKRHTKMTENEKGKQPFLKIDGVPHAGIVSRMYAAQWFTILHRPAAGANRNFIWQVDHYALWGRKQSVFCLSSFFFTASQPPFSAHMPWGKEKERVYDTCEMVRPHVNVTDPSDSYAVFLLFRKFLMAHQPFCSTDLWQYEVHLSAELFFKVFLTCVITENKQA